MLVTQFEQGKLSRSQLVQGLSIAASSPAAAQAQSVPYPATGIDHVQITVADLNRTQQFYEKLFGAKVANRRATQMELHVGLTFAFNGGPGSSSVWLHIGVLGPKRVVLGPDGEQPPPPYRLVDNSDSLIEFTDLVFIDPVTTGYSRHAPGEDPKQFHSLEGDLNSVADFIRLYTGKFDRWSSPKFLAGESYGTTRAAGLAEVLREQGIYLNGITLISSVLNFETISSESP